MEHKQEWPGDGVPSIHGGRASVDGYSSHPSGKTKTVQRQLTGAESLSRIGLHVCCLLDAKGFASLASSCFTSPTRTEYEITHHIDLLPGEPCGNLVV